MNEHKESCPKHPNYLSWISARAGGSIDLGRGECNCGVTPKNHYETLMKEAMELHERKAHDYSKEGDKFSNFTRAAEPVSWFKNPIDQVFICMIMIKIARLAELRNGKEAKNESKRDSHIDLINYSALWGSFHEGQDNLISKDTTFKL